MFGHSAPVWQELLELRAVLGMPQRATVHGLALVLVGKGTGTAGWQCHIVPMLPFQTNST